LENEVCFVEKGKRSWFTWSGRTKAETYFFVEVKDIKNQAGTRR